MSQRESFGRTITVAVVLCVACSVLVSAAAVGLRPRQDVNKLLDRQKNILEATGLATSETGQPAATLSRGEVDRLFQRIEPRLVDLESGELVDGDATKYDERKAAKELASRVKISKEQFDIGIEYRAPRSTVYFVYDKNKEKLQQIVLPIYGKGLWSTLFGFLAIDKDLETVRGLTFYEHAETPGLGGEVDNPSWKTQWKGKRLYAGDHLPSLGVNKGPAPVGDEFLVDGLTGATITSRGVTQLVRYWVSEDGFGPFLKKLGEENGSTPAATEEQGNG